MENLGLSGLVNLGNTCFMNAAIQCLSNVHDLTEYFINDEYKKNENKKSKRNDVLNNWARLIKGMWENNCVVSPMSFHKNIRMIAAREGYLNFTGFRQNDTQEFLILLIDSLHDGLSREVNVTISGKVKNETDRMALEAMKTWKIHFKDNYSKIVSLFYGQYLTEISACDNPEDVLSRNYDPFCYLNIPIPLDKSEPSIYDCFSLFSEEELMDGDNKYQHPKTNEYVDAKKHTKFWSLPKVLIVSLKRFTNNRGKIDKLITFPLEILNLSKYLKGYNKKAIYNLIGVSNHSGSSGGGHYYSYCKGKNGNWYEYNDTRVNKITPSQIVTSNAYVLFYKMLDN